MAKHVVVGFERWRLRHPLLEAGGHVRLGIAKGAVAMLEPVERPVDDGNDIDTGSPRPTRLQVQLNARTFGPDGKILAEFDHGVSPTLTLARVAKTDAE